MTTRAGEDLRAEVAADLHEAGATIAEVQSGVAFVDLQLLEINATLTRLKAHHRLMNVLSALLLAVVVVIAVNVIVG